MDIIYHGPGIESDIAQGIQSSHIDWAQVENVSAVKNKQETDILIIRLRPHTVVTRTPTSLAILPDPSYVPSVEGVCDECGGEFHRDDDELLNICYTCSRKSGICRTCGHAGGWAGCAECIPY